MTRLARRIALAMLLLFLIPTPYARAQDDDPYLWLEDVTGDRSLDWVKTRNAESTKTLSQSPSSPGSRSGSWRSSTRTIASRTSASSAPGTTTSGATRPHPRGVWRRTTLDEYRKPEPEWETVIDLDALASAENENWVWSGADCLKPEYRRCLVSLSRGGADAAVTREFDVTTRAFVADGYTLPEAKATVSWRDLDSLFVGTDFGAGSLTESGYPRIIKEWKRGTALADAPIVFEAKPDGCSCVRVPRPDAGVRTRLRHPRRHVLDVRDVPATQRPADQDREARRRPDPVGSRSPVPHAAQRLEGRRATYPAGALIAADFEAFLKGKAKFDVLFEPSERKSLEEFEPTRHHVLLNELDNVRNRLCVLTRKDGKWKREPLPGLPEIGTFAVSAIDPDESDDYFVTTSDYLTPDRLLLGTIGKGARRDAQEPARAVQRRRVWSSRQHEATSKDGTRIPYFQVARKDLPARRRAIRPCSTATAASRSRCSRATRPPSARRGWRRAACTSWRTSGAAASSVRSGTRPRSRRTGTRRTRTSSRSPRTWCGERSRPPTVWASMGGSNGGLLMGNMLTMRPDLFGAIVCQVPLLDMRRYHKLLAGASWVGEYGDPDDPQQWAFMKTFSPYHNVRKDAAYPPTLFTTSTRDDRVHPGHARKMAARMLEQGHDVTYYENIEGGHGGAANNAQRAFMSALAYRFLWTELQHKDASTASAASGADGPRTFKGEFTWSQRNHTGDIEAIFTPTGNGTWDVAFHFLFRDQPHVYAGTASGELSAGELQGTVQNENKERTFRFRGQIEDGKFEGRHVEVDGTDEQETGTLTLDIAG